MPTHSRFVTMRMLLLLLLSFFHLRACHSSPSMQPLCHDEESHALMQFKQSLVINESVSSDPSAYPKVASWKVDGESGDCCSWDGVECDRVSGHVIGLDLSSSCLYGSIDSNSSLFNLVHLGRLNLADNNFNNSKIPSEIRNLLRLFDLDLSHSSFSGQIPAEILELSKLLQKPGLQHLVEALTNLEVLHLGGVDISAKVPQIMANLSSLSSLSLRDCGLQGEFPLGIFQLSSLHFLSIRNNPYLTGYLPEFQSGSNLELLLLGGTSFSGQLPESIGNLKSLKEFHVAGCYFSGAIPSSLGNLTKLNSLDLSSNNFTPSTLEWLGNLTELNSLRLIQTNSYGNLPSSIRNFTQLTVLELTQNKLTGQIPSWIGNHTLFISLMLGFNRLHGPIPESIFRLPNLEALDLQENLFRGTVNVGLLRSRSLVSFQLSGNNLSVIGNNNDSFALPKFQILGLGGCNLSGEFPSFLHGQTHLESVDLSENKIEGHIPKWFMNLGNLRYLRLSENKLEGALPIPPRSTIIYTVSDNRLTGEIPPAICNLTSLVILELSNNYLNSKLPQCLGNISNYASALDLRNNSFSGDIPDAFSSGCTLRAIDFSQNQLEGKIPRSLANCNKLEILNIGKNKINDVFPSWLGIFPKLRVLILRSNKLHGMIGKPRANFEFQRLQIVDLSGNCFRGKLPLEYFRNWTAMKTIYKERPLYMQVVSSFQLTGYELTNEFDYSMTMTNKGVLTSYEKIQEFLTAIDLSSNRFEGGIPDALGDLKELYLLNLSNNLLTGRIPPSLSNLKELEALDLSQNKLSGEIPVQLAQLTFLAVFNVSHNVLSGPIPRGNQFDTFGRTSFDANPGLCGKPLSRKCGNGEDSLPAAKRDEGSAAYPLEFGWKVVVIGYASGLVIGVILGCVMDTRKYEWLVKNYFARWQR
uniref:Uncharacterized protein n=1 Tax=Salix viminalis TaxID=40686 RepID=A0A6N2K880_SALVM